MDENLKNGIATKIPEDSVSLEDYAKEIKEDFPDLVKFEEDKEISLEFVDENPVKKQTPFGEKLMFRCMNLDLKEKQNALIGNKRLLLDLAAIKKKNKKLGKLRITRSGKAKQTRYKIEVLK